MADDITARMAVAVTPSDTVGFTPCRALYIGVTGDVTLVPRGSAAGTAVLFKAVPVGMLPVQATRVNSSGTTATNIVALY